MLKNHFGCVKKMLEHEDVDVNCKNDTGRTLLSLTLDSITENTVSQVEFLLLKKHADPNIADENGYAPLHYICKAGVP